MAFRKGPVLLVPALFSLCVLMVALISLGPGLSQLHAEPGGDRVRAAAFDSLLQQVVRGSRVDYQKLARKPSALLAYVDDLSRADVSSLTHRSDSLAFFINAYNANTLLLVLNRFPEIESVLDPIGEPGEKGDFFRQPIRVGGALWTLDSIEHQVLRGQFGDARIHFAVNCASVSCPPLRDRLYTGGGIEDELSESTRQYLLDPNHVRWSPAGDTLHVSELFHWFEEDFLSQSGSLARFVGTYVDAPDNAASRPSVTFLPYDWSLNDTPRD